MHHVSQVSHFKQILASHNVVTHPAVSVKSILLPLNAAAQILGQVAHVHHIGHWSHFSPLGIPKLNTAAQQVQLLVTVASHQGHKVDVVHTVIVPDGH